MTDNEAMQDSGVEWIEEIPKGWHIDRIKDKTTLVVGGDWGDEPDSKSIGENVIVLRVADIEDRYFKSDNLTIRKIKTSSLKNRLINKHTILLEKSGGGEKQLVGRAALPKNFLSNAICSNFMAKIDFQTTVDIEYINYLLSSLYFQNLNYPHIQQTTGIQNLNVTYYLSTKVLFPPIYEQLAITQYLDQRCGKLDAVIAIKQQQIKELDALQRNTISEAVTRGFQSSEFKETGNIWMPEIPEHWKLVNLKRVSKIQTGFTLGKQYEGKLIERPYLRVANVQDGHLNLTDLTTIEVPVNVAWRVELRAGDVLMTEGGDLDKLGRGTVWNADIPSCLHQNHIFAVRCFQHKLLPAFLAYLTTSRYGRDYFEATGKRTTNLASTNSTKVGQLPIPLPPLSEQKRICDYLENKLSAIAKISAGIEAQITTLQTYKKSLIYECVTGKKRIKADDLKTG